MLPKKHRLPVKDFPPKAELLFRSQRLLVKAVENNIGTVRIGISASKKNVPKAATRNAIKRNILDGLMNSLDALDERGIDLLIIISAPIIKLDLETEDLLRRDVKKITELIKKDQQ